MWGTFLSEPLDIVASVGRYPTDQLMSREPIRHRFASLPPRRCLPRGPWGISHRFQRLSPCGGQVAHALRTLAPVAIKVALLPPHAAPRLACVKPAASVHPEPGSNSSLYILISLSLTWTFSFLFLPTTLQRRGQGTDALVYFVFWYLLLYTFRSLLPAGLAAQP